MAKTKFTELSASEQRTKIINYCYSIIDNDEDLVAVNHKLKAVEIVCKLLGMDTASTYTKTYCQEDDIDIVVESNFSSDKEE